MCVIIYNSSLSVQAASKAEASHFFQLHRHLNRGGNDNIPLFGLFRVIQTHVDRKKGRQCTTTDIDISLKTMTQTTRTS